MKLNLLVKIISGYVMALLLMAIVGTVAIVRINQINATVVDLTGNLAVDLGVGAGIRAGVQSVRLSANRYLSTPSDANLAGYSEAWKNFGERLTAADEEIAQPARVEMVKQIRSDSAAYAEAFDEIVQLAQDRAAIVGNEMDVQGPLAEAKLRELRNSAFADKDLEEVQLAGDASTALLLMRFNAYKYLQAGDEQWITLFDQRYEEATKAFDSLDVDLENATRRGLMQEAHVAVEAYQTAFTNLRADFARENELVNNVLNVAGPEIYTIVTELIESVQTDFHAQEVATQSLVNQTRTILLIVMVVAIVLTLGLGIVLARSISGAAKQMAEVANDISQGLLDHTITVKGQDEMAEMATAFRHMIDYLKRMAAAAVSIADGDLTVEVQPQSAQDELGVAFQSMTTNLRDLIRSVTEGINDVTTSSSQLNDAAGQAGQATAQIAETVGHVAAANAQQNHSLENTRRVIEMQTQAIMGIAEGAQKQAHAVEEANRTLTKRLGVAVSQVQSATEESSVVVAGTSQETKNGAAIVNKTVNGMKLIASKSELVAERVAEMGERSKEIGTIVNAIEAIAERTNLLALNAAIEAARAGEHGKGFAVVADEVRKLAEQASRAAAEVGSIVHAVQLVAEQATNAMKESRHEVDNGMEMANETGEVLGRIQHSVNQVEQQIVKLGQSVVEMTGGNEEMSRLMMEVAAIVEENSASAEQIAASSNEVMQSVEDLSAISEENSASTEQVSASTEEVSAQVDQTAASANMLAQMAQSLMEQVSRFRVDEHAERASSPVRPALGASSVSNGWGNGSHKESLSRTANHVSKRVPSLN